MSYGPKVLLLHALGHLMPMRAAALGIRRRLYGNRHGLRIMCLHRTQAQQIEQIRYLIDYGRKQFDMASPEDAIRLIEGRAELQHRDSLLFSFDDGFGDNYDAACTLSSQGIRAIFFVIPSFIGRSVAQYYSFHESNGIQSPPNLLLDSDCAGLSLSKLREMSDMGHLIAAHNYSHRDLGQLHDKQDLDYEIGRSIDQLSEQLQKPCFDFAWAFGQAAQLSIAAAEYLVERNMRIYSATRGLNVAGVTPKFLGRDHITWKFPNCFARAILAGALDDRFLEYRNGLGEISGTLPPPQSGSN